MTNNELFNLYDSDLVLRSHNARNLSDQEYQQSDKSLSGAIDALLKRMPFPIRAIQVDSGSEFEAIFEEEY